MDAVGNISDETREAVTEMVRNAISSGKGHPLPLDSAELYHANGWVDALPCSDCGRPVLDDEALLFPHLHTFEVDCDAPPRQAPHHHPPRPRQVGLWM